MRCSTPMRSVCWFLNPVNTTAVANFIVSDDVEKYALAHTTEDDAILKELYRETFAKVLWPGMISGPLQGRLLSFYSQMMQPSRILEVGTFTGYSAICLARGLRSGGKLISIEKNPEIEDFAKKFFVKAGLQEQIDMRIGDALEIIPGLNEVFDLVFIDADKENYLNYFELIFDKVRPGGFIIADNVLWYGKVLGPCKGNDKETLALKEFNAYIKNHPRLDNLLLPLRDGLMLMRKKTD